MPLDFSALIYSGEGGAGVSRLLGGGRGSRSDGDDGVELMAAGLMRPESFHLSTSNRTDVSLILCEGSDYSGRFAQATLAKGGGTVLGDCWGPIGSAYLAATRRTGENELRQSARGLLLTQWLQFIDAALGGTQVRREGNPIFAWQPFSRLDHLHPDLVYLKAHQALHIDIDWWPDYSASFTYHLLPYIDSGHVRVWGARWAVWVEGGLKHDRIVDQLSPRIRDGLGSLTTELNRQLANYDALGTVNEVYLLPGNQTSPAVPHNLTGHTDQDVTIVVVR